jgi:hypothetical protein
LTGQLFLCHCEKRILAYEAGGDAFEKCRHPYSWKGDPLNAPNVLATTRRGADGESSASFSVPEQELEEDAPKALRLDRMQSSIPELRKAFLAAAPWPHLVLDDLVDPDVAARAEKEEAAFATRLRPHRSHRLVKAESAVPGGPTAKGILEEMLSPEFIGLVEGVTGIKDLIGDPNHFWGGLHASKKGFFQSIHTDFERHPTPGLFHRVNVLLYLNSEWEPQFRGELELWPKDMSACGRKIAPLIGRVVIFVTDPTTVHGVPDPIACPSERFRLSLASYYYTTEKPDLISLRDRLVQAQRPQDSWLRAVTGPSNLFGAWHLRRLRKAAALPPS